MAESSLIEKAILHCLDKYKCSICLDVLKQPTLTRCGHRFCQFCLDSWFRSRSECPNCKQNLNKCCDVFPDNFTKRELMELRVECPNAQLGCPVKISIDNLEEHKNLCLFTSTINEDGKIECSFAKIGCKHVFIISADYQNHLKDFVQEHLNMTINAYSNVTLDNCHDQRIINQQIGHLNEMHGKLNGMHNLLLTTMSYRGILVWVIGDFSEKCKMKMQLNSLLFYSSFFEYKYFVRVLFFEEFINIKVFLVYSQYESELKWPCKIKNCTISILKYLEDLNGPSVKQNKKSNISISRPSSNQPILIFKGKYNKNELEQYLLENRLCIKVNIELDEDQ